MVCKCDTVACTFTVVSGYFPLVSASLASRICCRSCVPSVLVCISVVRPRWACNVWSTTVASAVFAALGVVAHSDFLCQLHALCRHGVLFERVCGAVAAVVLLWTSATGLMERTHLASRTRGATAHERINKFVSWWIFSVCVECEGDGASIAVRTRCHFETAVLLAFSGFLLA